MTNYKAYRIIDGKPRWIIVNENGDITDRNPSKDDLRYLERLPEKHGKSKPRYTDEELLDYPKQFVRKYGRVPTYNDFQNCNGYPSADTYRKRFGNWINGLEMSGLNIENRLEKYTDEELLDYPKKFLMKYGRVPTARDFYNDPGYPYSSTYRKRFGSWSNTLKLVGMDLDTRIVQKQLETRMEKGRLAEIGIIEMFYNKGIDLSGDNCNNHLDGICPNGMMYEVKSSKLYIEDCFIFGTQNKDKDDDVESIQWYYFIAFNMDYTKMLYVWRVPGEIVETCQFSVGLNSWSRHKFNIVNMKEYDITDKFKNIIMIGNNKIWKNIIKGENIYDKS